MGLRGRSLGTSSTTVTQNTIVLTSPLSMCRGPATYPGERRCDMVPQGRLAQRANASPNRVDASQRLRRLALHGRALRLAQSRHGQGVANNLEGLREQCGLVPPQFRRRSRDAGNETPAVGVDRKKGAALLLGMGRRHGAPEPGQ
jgi:hypothetical protein